MTPLETACRKLLGLEPYNKPDNQVYGDGYFAESIKRDFGEVPFLEMIDKLRRNSVIIHKTQTMGKTENMNIGGENVYEETELTLGQKLEIAFDKRFEIEAIETKAKEMKQDYEQLQMEILNEMSEKDLDQIKCARGTATLKVEPYPNIKDANEFFNWIADTRRFEFVEKRCSRAAVKDMLATEGVLPPGIDTFMKSTLSIRKAAVRKS